MLKSKAHQGYIEIEVTNEISVAYIRNSHQVKLCRNHQPIDSFFVDEGYKVSEFFKYIEGIEKSLTVSQNQKNTGGSANNLESNLS